MTRADVQRLLKNAGGKAAAAAGAGRGACTHKDAAAAEACKPLHKSNVRADNDSLFYRKVRYDIPAATPVEADGHGPSLERVRLDGFANDAQHWRMGRDGGFPGGVPEPAMLTCLTNARCNDTLVMRNAEAATNTLRAYITNQEVQHEKHSDRCFAWHSGGIGIPVRARDAPRGAVAWRGHGAVE